MRHTVLLCAVLVSCLISPDVFAGPGDTIVVKTFSFSQRAPYEGKFLFPPKTTRFEKILMRYTLKCNPEQTPACGEWDYLTYTYLYNHTGIMDSTLLSHSNFTVNGGVLDTLGYMLHPTYSDMPRFESFAVRTDTQSIHYATVGQGASVSADALPAGAPDARSQYAWTASELAASGLQPGPITGIRLSVVSAGGDLGELTIRMRRLSSGGIELPMLDSLTTVYHRTTRLENGWNTIAFATSFEWTGSDSMLIVDFSFATNGSAYSLAADPAPPGSAAVSSDTDGVLDFAPTDWIDVPVANLAHIDRRITVAFWQYGDPAAQPRDASVFEAVTSTNQRILNAHVPWSNGHVYWDAGSDGSYDRIETAAQPENYRGGWNHWAFTKDVDAGTMTVYLNGRRWLRGTGKTKSMAGISRFRIGSGANGGMYYDGMIDAFTILDTAADEEAVRALMTREPAPGASLMARYAFDETTGLSTREAVSGAMSSLVGYPIRQSYRGDRVKNFRSVADRPQITFEQGVFTSRTDSVFILDSIDTHPLMIVLFGDSLHPATPTDTLYRWPATKRYTYDSQGRIIDSTTAAPDSLLLRKDSPYYSEPFEVVNRYELGRFITPYGNGLDLGDGWTWVYDVSDFRPLLADSVDLAAGNWQELLDLTFLFIEGTPPRDVTSIRNMWNGNWALSTFDKNVPPITVTLDPSAKAYRLKLTTTGHGMAQPNNCAEFCPKIHSVDIDGVTRYSWQIIQPCAMNPLFPQGGTWIYARAGWCPGAPCSVQNLELTPFVSGPSMTVDYNAESDPGGNYVVESQLVSYSNPNFSLDAALDDIVEPNNDKLRKRYNPSCRLPRVIIRNSGSTLLTSLDITYGPVGRSTNTYHWTGALPFLQTQEVELPALDWVTWNQHTQFTASVSNPNGSADEYPLNNSRTVSYDPVDVYDKPIVVAFQTNAAAWENSYEILDAQGQRVVWKQSLNNSTIYRDTMRLAPGCYEFVLRDSGDDGLYFFSFNNDGRGSISFKVTGGGWPKSLESNFGREIRYSFIVSAKTGIDARTVPEGFSIFPNPTADQAMLHFSLDVPQRLGFEISDVTGRRVQSLPEQEYANGEHTVQFALGHFPAGEYVVQLLRNGVPAGAMRMTIVR